MSAKFWIEAFGYLGSALVVVSMLMSSVIKLRIINMIGSIIFAIYALIIKSYPTAVMNFFLVGINIYHLARLKGSTTHYDVIELTDVGEYLTYFLNYYREDIKKYFPKWDGKASGDAAYLVCCDSAPAGLLMGMAVKEDEKAIDIILDYSTPAYRDCSVGAFLYEKLPGFGVKKLIYRGKTAEHIAYAEKMGFKKEDGALVKEL